MAKYDPLQRYLRRHRSKDEIVLTFTDIERVIGGFLPKAAGNPHWWSTTDRLDEEGPQQRAWLDAGYVASLGAYETVTFERVGSRLTEIERDQSLAR